MKLFNQFNSTTPCPICGCTADTPAVLIAIDGTAEDGIEQAMQVHLACVNLRVKRNVDGEKGNMMIYQFAKDIS